MSGAQGPVLQFFSQIATYRHSGEMEEKQTSSFSDGATVFIELSAEGRVMPCLT